MGNLISVEKDALMGGKKICKICNSERSELS